MRTMPTGAILLLAGIPALILANANQPEYDCNAAAAACEHGHGTLTPVGGRFSEGTYELVYTLGFGLIALGIGLTLVGLLVLRSRPSDSSTS